MISAKSLAGKVYSYHVKTAGEFKYAISIEKQIPIKLLKLFGMEDELLDDAVLSPDEVYSLSFLRKEIV